MFHRVCEVIGTILSPKMILSTGGTYHPTYTYYVRTDHILQTEPKKNVFI